MLLRDMRIPDSRNGRENRLRGKFSGYVRALESVLWDFEGNVSPEMKYNRYESRNELGPSVPRRRIQVVGREGGRQAFVTVPIFSSFR